MKRTVWSKRIIVLASVLAVSGTWALIDRAEVVAATDPVITTAGDISCDPLNSGFNGGDGTATDCREKFTAALLTGSDAVLALGDEQYACGGLSAFNQAYEPSWGTSKPVTYPVPGNHEYQSSGGTDCASGAFGYFTYFGARAGDPSRGYYSYNLGSWHIIALNSECSFIGGCGSGSSQETWLKNDLAANASAPCTLAYWHRPRFASTSGGGDTTFSAFWQDLYAAKVDVVLNGHEHWYERFAPQGPSGQADPAGIREFIVGTGGESYVQPAANHAVNSEVLNWGQNAFGVLKMTLHAGSYDWAFVPVTGTFSDTGSTACHNASQGGPDTTAPTTTVACNAAPCSSGWYRAIPISISLSATDFGGSGLASTTYTTDGSDPTSSSTAVTYTGPFSISETTTVRFSSSDNAGNQETVRSQTIRVDAAAPSVNITSPADGSSVKRGATVTVTAAATDSGTGTATASGIARVDFYLDGKKTASASTSPYAFSWATRRAGFGAHRLWAIAVDVAGNATTSAMITVTIAK